MGITWKYKQWQRFIIDPFTYIHIVQVLLCLWSIVTAALVRILNTKSFLHLTDMFLRRYLGFLIYQETSACQHSTLIASPSSDLSAVWSEPINIFHGSYETDLPPIRLSYHRGNHYNSIVDPCNPAVGVGLGFGSLRGVSENVSVETLSDWCEITIQDSLPIFSFSGKFWIGTS